MTDQAAVKRILQDLIRRDDLGNKTCADCPNPNPQWASVSFAVFICLQCAGAHRSYGVHVSFVRSVSMDTWSDDQIRRMQLGGNKPLHDFLAAYEPADQGGYDTSMSAHDKYHCWAATQYREKLDYTLQDKPWSPSPPPPPSTTSPPGSRPSSAQSLRKSRTGAGATRGPSAMSRTASSSSSPSPATSPNPGSNSPNAAALDRKTANENYFASLGSTNALRPADLPPSQGGRYAGFGSTPPPTSSAGGGDFLTSRNAPTLTDLQDDPIRALSKGWSLFAGAVAGAGKAFSENVLQPGVEKVQDPAFQASVRGYVEGAQKSLGQAGASANAWSRDTLGVDVGAAMGGVGRGGVGGSSRAGYGAVPGYAGQEETSALYRDNEDDEEDFFAEFAGEGTRKSEAQVSSAAGAAASSSAKVEAKPAGKANDGWDDDWKEF